jgi:putative pyruvate formate lyase activating enzyme
MTDEFIYDLNELENCTQCPRECAEDRFSAQLGWCCSNAGINISSICIHKGEEPVISGKNGICNVFFTSCNMQCIYCQNYQISRHGNNYELRITNYDNLESILNNIIRCLESGCESVGFVSPSHHIPQMKIIIKTLLSNGIKPIFVMNTNSYDKVETIKSLEGMIDVYLPDFKYSDELLGRTLSKTHDYPKSAITAIKEMFRQKGSSFVLNARGIIESGLIIRHLVLPGYIENSINALRIIAEEISTSIHLSLMSQYYPTEKVKNHPKLNRTLTSEEYDMVVEEMERFGFENGWIQDLESSETYLPDFRLSEPFIL